MLIFHLRMYCFPMIVLERRKCIQDDTVFFLSGCTIPLAISCNRWLVSDIGQRLSVPGPCRMALDLHLWMLGRVFTRSYFCYYFGTLGWNELFTLSEVAENLSMECSGC